VWSCNDNSVYIPCQGCLPPSYTIYVWSCNDNSVTTVCIYLVKDVSRPVTRSTCGRVMTTVCIYLVKDVSRPVTQSTCGRVMTTVCIYLVKDVSRPATRSTCGHVITTVCIYLVKCGLDLSLTFSVECGRGFIQQQYLWVSHESSCYCNALLLSTTQLLSTLTNQCLVFLHQHNNLLSLARVNKTQITKIFYVTTFNKY